MASIYFNTVVTILIVISQTSVNAKPTYNDGKVLTESSKPTDDGKISERIGLTFGAGSAVAQGSNSASSSVSSTNTFSAGILDTNTGIFTSLYDGSQSFHTSQTQGQRAPQSWSSSTGSGNQHHQQGHASAGYSGNHGNTNAVAISSHQEIDLGGGLIALSDLDAGDNRSPSPKEDKSGNILFADGAPVSNNSDMLLFRP